MKVAVEPVGFAGAVYATQQPELQGTPIGQVPTVPSVPWLGVPSVTLLHETVRQGPEVENGRHTLTVLPAQTAAVVFGVVTPQTLIVTVAVSTQPSTSVIRYVIVSVPVKVGFGV